MLAARLVKSGHDDRHRRSLTTAHSHDKTSPPSSPTARSTALPQSRPDCFSSTQSSTRARRSSVSAVASPTTSARPATAAAESSFVPQPSSPISGSPKSLNTTPLKKPQPHSQPHPQPHTKSPSPPRSLSFLSRTLMAILSPRSADYQRLEGGLGPGRTGPRGPHRAGTLSWKKLALGVAFVVGLVWLVMPSGKTEAALGMGGGKSKEPWYHDDEADTEPFVPAPPTTAKGTHPNTAADASATNGATPNASSHDSKYPSFETDPDPTKTPHCTHPHTPSARLVQYALMIDAGSTGSRIHVYKFNNCGSSPAYEYEVFKLTKPGLSDYAGRPDDAARSLDVLMDEAVRVVPAPLRSCTPVAVKATAGLRRLDGSKSTDILKAIEQRLREKYPFPLPEKDAVQIMEGKDEGVFAWITANYLLGTISPDGEGNESKKAGGAESGTGNSTTYAVLDLGGASTQIVFEPFFSKPDASLIEGEHKYELAFGGRTHTLYQHSYLDYGLTRARQHVHQLVDFLATIRGSSSSSGGGGRADVGDVLVNPCLARGTRKVVGVEDDKAAAVRNVTMDGQDVGSFEACSRLVQLVMAKDAICETKPCAFNGVYQPSLLETFASGKVMLLSYFYDRLFELLDPDSYASLRISTIASLAEDVCAGGDAWSKRWGAQPRVIKELEGRPEWCLDLTFMYTLLRLGYEFEDDRVVGIGKRMRGTELGWCLGATLAMVGGELTCKV